jgi:hypothetical protein
MHVRQFLLLLILVIPHFGASLGAESPPPEGFPDDQKAAAAQIVVPAVHYREVPLQKVVQDLQLKSKGQLGNPDSMVNIIVALQREPMPAVTIEAEGRSVWEVLNDVAGKAGCEVQEESHALIIREKGAARFPQVRAGPGVDLKQARAKLCKIVFPRAEFLEVPVEESPEFLMNWTRKLDPTGAGLKISVKKPRGSARGRPFTFEVRQIPVLELVRYIAGVSGLAVTVEKSGLVLSP